MNKVFMLVFTLVNFFAFSQVGINTDLPKSTFDIQNNSKENLAEGFMTVRIKGDDLQKKDALYTEEQNSDVVYVTVAPKTPKDKTSNITSPGFYYYNSGISKWVGLQMPKFFYMPSIYFDTTKLGPATKMLYDIYKEQFTNPAVASENSLGKVPILGQNDLEYYITYIDTNVFKDVKINANGEMSYRVADNASDVSFINIVFVVK